MDPGRGGVFCALVPSGRKGQEITIKTGSVVYNGCNIIQKLDLAKTRGRFRSERGRRRNQICKWGTIGSRTQLILLFSRKNLTRPLGGGVGVA